MTTWYTADLHFGHRGIIEYCQRPWQTVEEMDHGLVQRWNAHVRPDDTVWVLGDVALYPRDLTPVAGLNGHKVLVAGNHDACWTRRRRGRDVTRARHMIKTYLDAGFAEVYDTGEVRAHALDDGTIVNLAHLPYEGDSRDEPRYEDRRPVNNGLPVVCGHVHTAWRSRDAAQGVPQINVGVDQWNYGPVDSWAVSIQIQAAYREQKLVELSD